MPDKVHVPAALLVALVFYYFLLFAQFGFLHLLDDGFSPDVSRMSMGCMAAGGVIGSILAALRFRPSGALLSLAIGFTGCCLAAIGSITMAGTIQAVLAGMAIGGFLGFLTVSLIGYLSIKVAPRAAGLTSGIGTGLAYALSNIPAVHKATPTSQALLVAAACVLGVLLVVLLHPLRFSDQDELPASVPRGYNLLAVTVVAFLILVWADSAAFRLIQTDESLLAGSWSDGPHLLAIAAIHLLAAVAGGWLLDRGRKGPVLLAAFAGLWIGHALIARGQFGLAGPWVYVSAVSLYSTGLVAFPLKARAGLPAVVQAAWIFALAGWIGSGIGIGMADDLGHFPPMGWITGLFLLLSALVLMNRCERMAGA